eukprot:3052918-Ditylum_brightwellii.AAC.1
MTIARNRGFKQGSNGRMERHNKWIVEDYIRTTSSGKHNAKTTTISEQMQFLPEAVGSPVTSTWTTAVKNNYFISWPGLTADNINKHLPKS